MLGSIKFLAWSIKLKTSYGILSSLKLTTLYLICNCQISSISLLFLYLNLIYITSFPLFLTVISVVLLPLIRLFQHLGNLYFFFQIFSGIFRENRYLKWILSHEGHTPKWKVSKIEIGKNNVSKNRGCIFYCF